MLRLSTRAGVPVLSRSVSNPNATRLSVRPSDGASPARPAARVLRPTQICPDMNVPVVSTTAGARNSIPKNVRTPATSSLEPTRTSVAIPSRIIRLGWRSRRRRISREYSHLSVCARSAHTAGPLLALSTLFWR